ncbi:MAG: endonuclease III [Bacilli bacterium]|nr:endonuclease III [Bacilli bacterium]
MNNEILDKLNIMIKNPKCELNYSKDYELLIATVLSAQCTDKRVNIVTKKLWEKYDIFSLANASISDIEEIIKPCGTYTRKSVYIKSIATSLVNDFNGIVPNDRNYLEKLPGVGHKTCNVVLSNIYNEDLIAVDTHVTRVSKRLGWASKNDDVLKIEKKLMKIIPKNEWTRRHHQLVLFGRYICKAINPNCENCLLKEYCKYYKKENKL